MKFRNLPAAQFGRLGEIVAARQFRRADHGLIATYKYSGETDDEAPAIEVVDGLKEIVPDFDLCKEGDRIWVEVKTYGTSPINRMLGCRTHGISVRLYDNYLAVEARSGSPVYLAVLEIDSGLLLLSAMPISEMRKHECQCGCHGLASRHTDTGGVRGPQWYFERDHFLVQAQIEEREAEWLRHEHARLIAPSHAIQRHGPATVEPAQLSMFSFDAINAVRDPLRGGSR